MKSANKHINYLAIALVCLLAFGYSTMASHSLFVENEDESHICSNHDNESHLHAYHTHHHCLVCTFSFPIFYLENWQLNIDKKEAVLIKKTLPVYQDTNYSFSYVCPNLRGPPFA